MKEREKTQSTGPFPDVNQAWENFQNFFLPDREDCLLHPMKDSDQTAFEEKRDKPAKSRLDRLLKQLALLAAIIAETFPSMVTVRMFGFDIFSMLARWTSEIFHFSAEAAP